MPAYTCLLMGAAAESVHGENISCQKSALFFNKLLTVIHSLFTSGVGDGEHLPVKKIISENFARCGLFHIRRKRV
ncbi:hypothetical protein NKH36_21700 [Mesorhizobium sp. M1312]|uniref:hypothetical protein n=1 Tax=unclassified Mesorhizobium TaxID=325217 RepID=UPI00333561E2